MGMPAPRSSRPKSRTLRTSVDGAIATSDAEAAPSPGPSGSDRPVTPSPRSAMVRRRLAVRSGPRGRQQLAQGVPVQRLQVLLVLQKAAECLDDDLLLQLALPQRDQRA